MAARSNPLTCTTRAVKHDDLHVHGHRRPLCIAAKRTVHSKASGVATGLRMIHEVHLSFPQGVGNEYLSGEIPRGNTDQNAVLIDFKLDILVGVEPSP